jgi:hypothetical protein
MDWNIGSKIVGFITLGCTVLGIASKKSNWHAPYSKKMNNFKTNYNEKFYKTNITR